MVTACCTSTETDAFNRCYFNNNRYYLKNNLCLLSAKHRLDPHTIGKVGLIIIPILQLNKSRSEGLSNSQAQQPRSRAGMWPKAAQQNTGPQPPSRLPFQLLGCMSGLFPSYRLDCKARSPGFNAVGRGHKSNVFRGQKAGLASVSKRQLEVVGSVANGEAGRISAPCGQVKIRARHCIFPLF